MRGALRRRQDRARAHRKRLIPPHNSVQLRLPDEGLRRYLLIRRAVNAPTEEKHLTFERLDHSGIPTAPGRLRA